MSTTICTLEGVPVIQDADGRVHFIADADIDADGANGQFGKRAAYMAGNAGSEDLANGGMRWNGHRVVGNSNWYKDIVICDAEGEPKQFPEGVIASKTALRLNSRNEPSSYVDSETVPYIVVSPLIRQKARGVVLGCLARVTYRGKSVDTVVADIGPRSKIGELSIAAARAVGIPSSPRNGGADSGVLYELFPGTKATLDGVTYPLVSA